MTKSKGVGRGAGSGGARPGAGRKPGPPPDIRIAPEMKAAAEKQVAKIAAATSEAKIVAPAAGLVHEAYATLADVMANCPLGAPRVAAAKAIIDLARAAEAEAAKAKADAEGVSGKKAAAQATAEAKVLSGGKFSAPAPPPGVMPGPDRFQ